MKPFFEDRSTEVFIGEICDHPFPVHLHMEAEMVYLFSGSLEINAGSERYTMRAGDACAIFPMMLHSYGFVSPDARGLTMIFMPDAVKEYTIRLRELRPVSAFLQASPENTELAKTAAFIYSMKDGNGQALKNALIHLFLASIFDCMEMESIGTRFESETIERISSYLSVHYHEHITLDSVSEALKISRSHLSHVFGSQLRVNFRKYINILRADRAVSMLAENEDLSLNDIAYACGYEDVRTFRRAFLAETGTTPGEYRKKLKQITKNTGAAEA